MACSCNYPQEYLLPCRHVLKANIAESCAFGTEINQYRIGQIGLRWQYRHQPSERLKTRLEQSVIIPASIVGPSLLQLPTRRRERPKDRFRRLLSLSVTYIAGHFRCVEAYELAEQTLTELCQKKKNPS